jgi:hypothetical protein
LATPSLTQILLTAARHLATSKHLLALLAQPHPDNSKT